MATGATSSETYRACMGYPASPPPGSAAVTASHDAGVSVLPLAVLQRHKAWEQEQLDLTQTALRLGEGVPQMLMKGAGAIGVAGSAAISVASGKYESDKRFDALRASFGNLSAELGKTPEQMQQDDWAELAKRYPLLKQHLDQVGHEYNVRPRDSVANAGAAAAGMAVGQVLLPIPIVGGLIGGAAAGFACSSAIGAVDDVTADNTGVKAIEEISKTRAAGGLVSADEIMRAFVLGTPDLKTALEEQSAEGGSFSIKPTAELTPEEQARHAKLLQGRKAQKLLAYSGILADAINKDQMTAETLIRVDPAVLIGDKPVQIALQAAAIAKPAPLSDTEIAPQGPVDYTNREQALADFHTAANPSFAAREEARREPGLQPVRA